jgi:hypothetical protein
VNTVILTDGITDVLNFSKICGKVLIITNETECQIVSNGKVRQIVVEKE